eukprot:NODE_989_length_2776_cov_1.428091.p2 type:complete len:192 gc:universal NODE_989_length_2776_cov_1.428091:659-84(-)
MNPISTEEKKAKSQETLSAKSISKMREHSPSPSVHSAPINTSSVPPVKFDGKVDLRRIFSLIEYNGLRFLILDCPTDSTLPLIAAEFKKYNVSDVVRVCEPTYNTKKLVDDGIQVLDCPYLDGGTPPQHVILKFLGLVQDRFGDIFPGRKHAMSSSPSINESSSPKSTDHRSSLSGSQLMQSDRPCIAVHW